jgi:hydrogenase-4 component E
MTTAATLATFLGLVVTLVLIWRRSWPGRLRCFTIQSILLAGLAITLAVGAGKPALLVVAAVVVGLKAWLIPRVLARMAAAGQPGRPPTPGRSAGLALLAAGALVVVAYVIMLPVTRSSPVPTADAMPLAFATALIGLFACVTGRDAIGQILGFLVFENGVFALALLATYGLPAIVEAGVFLDVLVIVLIMEAVVLRLRREHDSLGVDRLRELRG